MKGLLVPPLVVALGMALLLGGLWMARTFGDPGPREALEALRDTLRVRRAQVDSCRMAVSREELEFQEYQRHVDSLRTEVRSFESLDPAGVPAERYDAYMEAFEGYNEAIPGWEARADSLEGDWRECRARVEEHNAVADSLRLLIEEPEPSEGGPPDRGSG